MNNTADKRYKKGSTSAAGVPRPNAVQQRIAARNPRIARKIAIAHRPDQKNDCRETISSLVLNIRRIRLVIRKPPTTFVEEHATAITPRTVLSGLLPDPAITMEPIREIP